MADNMENLRNAVRILVNQDLPLAERYDKAVSMLDGVGEATATPILLLAYPDHYGVWNSISEKEMKKHGVWPDFPRGSSKGEKYELINSVLLDLAKDLGVDLWTLDALWWATKEKPGLMLLLSRKGKPATGLPPVEDHIPQGREGAEVQVTSNRYERDPALRRACIDHFVSEDGRLMCQVCGMDFESRYGEIGRGFIHVHHCNPLGETQEEHSVDPTRDLKPVCPNCHAMLHKKPGKGAYEVEELQEMLEKQRAIPQT